MKSSGMKKSSDTRQSTSDGLHAAIIMDGNGRWASTRGLPRVAGHRAGAEALRRTVEAAPDLGIGILTVYAFSSDNWRRPQPEVVRADEDVPHLSAPRAGQVCG